MILRLLLACRDPDVVRGIRSAAGEDDVLLTPVEDAAAMWEHLRSKPCDLLVVERELLGAAPVGELEAIGALPDAPETIVLFVDGAEDDEGRAELLERGALACLGSDGERHSLHRIVRALVRRTQKQAVQDFMAEAGGRESYLSDFASKSAAMQSFLATVRKVVDTNSTLLLLGETGVGKEYLARAIHGESARRGKPFVAVNCAALPEALLESELFGHAAGAFTGAHKARRGYFELAHSGSIFLDEIAELPPHLQVKLLRVLQERRVQPVGAEREVPVDVRLIAATNRDLREEMEAKRFRSDLYYRLGVVTLTVPPLRERREDVPDLTHSHIEHFRKSLGRGVFGIQPDALDLLVRYPWPGNVRELINVVERAVLLAEGEEIAVGDLPEEIQTAAGGAPAAAHLDGARPAPGSSIGAAHDLDASDLLELPLQAARERLVEAFERKYLERLLGETQGRIGEAAERAGITSRSLYEKMKRLGLRKEAFKSPSPARRTPLQS